MATKGKSVVTRLACQECKERNYSQKITAKSGRKIGSLKLRKYCPRCREHHMHKETK